MVPVSTRFVEFELPPEGMHAGACVDVLDIGLRETNWQGHAKQNFQVRFVFQIEPRREKAHRKGERFTVSRNFNNVYGLQAALPKMLKAWTGHAFTPEEWKTLDLESFLWRPTLLNITYTVADGRTYANIENILPWPKGQEPLKPENYLRSEYDQKLVDEARQPIAAGPEEEVPF